MNFMIDLKHCLTDTHYKFQKMEDDYDFHQAKI